MLSISKQWKLMFFAAAFLGLLLISFTPGEADSNSGPGSGTSNSFAALTWLAASGNTGAIANSSSGLIRNPDGIVLTISTTGLLPGGAYTVWWVLFNEPEFCSPPGCDLGDLPPNGGNPNADASVLWATGRVGGRAWARPFQRAPCGWRSGDRSWTDSIWPGPSGCARGSDTCSRPVA